MRGTVRRTDLRLRSIYPKLVTTIFCIEENNYLIYISNPPDDFEELEKRFMDSIRQLTVPAKRTNLKPPKFDEIIPKIEDADISKGFEGVMITKGELLNLLMSKFPNIFFTDIR